MRLIDFATSVYRRNQGQTTLPRFLTYIVTFTCNARCIMCDSWKKSGKDDLTLTEIEAIFKQLPTLDAVRLTGGEPFVRKDFGEIAELVRVHLKPLFLHVTSNGFLTDRIVPFCESRSQRLPLRLLISLDGVEEKHNQVRGRETAWSTAYETLKTIAPRRRELNLHLSVNQTIVDPEGIDHYRRLRELLRPMGIQHNAVMAYNMSATYSVGEEVELASSQFGKFTPYGQFTDDQILDWVREVEKDLPGMGWADRISKRYYLQGIRNRLLRQESHPNPPCVALNTHLRIFPNGDVPTCQFNSRKVGNFRTESFAEIWSSDRIQKQRQWVSKCPGCWAECEVLPNAVYSGDLLKSFVPGWNRRADRPACGTLAPVQSEA